MYFDKEVFPASQIITDLAAKKKDAAALEPAMQLYEARMASLVNIIHRQNTILFSPFINLVKLNKVFVADKDRVYRFIEETNGSETQKKTLFAIADKSFLTLSTLLHTGEFMDMPLEYSASFGKEGIYTIYANGKEIAKEKNTSVVINNKPSVILPENSYWDNIGNYQSKADEKIRIDLHLSQNIDASSYLFGVPFNTLDKTNYMANITTSGILLSTINTIVGAVADWDENRTYVIYFEYKLKNTNDWKKYKAIVETGMGSQEALFLLLNNINDSSDQILQFYQPSEIDVRNLSITTPSVPKILAKRQDQEARNIPQITFTKINPTKYEIAVKGAADPYTLVFLDQFNAKWKLYRKDKGLASNTLLDSYYNGDIGEGVHKDIFLDSQTFETWGKQPIAEKTHTMVNGFANGWVIAPSDTNQQREYTLILEMTSQQPLYILLLLSFVTAGSCFIYLLFLFTKRITS